MPLFKEIEKSTLKIMEEISLKEEATFVVPARFLSTENACLAIILNWFVNYDRKKKSRYRSFFVNSRFEALSGAFKLARHYQFVKNKGASGSQILLLDLYDDFKNFINPLCVENGSDQMIPGVTIVSSLDILQKRVDEAAGKIAAVCIRSRNQFPDHKELSRLFKNLKEKEVISIFDAPELDFKKNNFFNLLDVMPDMITFGESLTGYQVPFGVFMKTERVQKPWTRMQTCSFHTSTYSGNKIAVNSALDFLKKNAEYLFQNESLKKELSKAEKNIDAVIKSYKKYINPGSIYFFSMLGYNFLTKKARGNRLSIIDKKSKSRNILDAVAGGGATTLGHNPDSLQQDIIKGFDNKKSYIQDLKTELKSVFGFDHVFPGISGASSVEMAIILSLLAAKKRKILSFKNNFAGKTMVAMIGTPDEESNSFFAPLYKDVIYIDPTAPDALKKTEQLIDTGEIGLVWFEMVQGSTLDIIPIEIIDLIQSKRSGYNFFIGVDEILMSFYRIGEITSYKKWNITPDVVTFSKALTGGVFPVSATLLNGNIYDQASKNNKAVVAFFESLYSNELAAKVALESLKRLLDEKYIAHIKKVQPVIEEGMKSIAEKSPIVESITGLGHIYRINYKTDNILYSFYQCNRAINRQNLFIYMNRIALSMCYTEEDIRELLEKLESLLCEKQNPFGFFRFMIMVTKNLILQG